MSVPLQGTAMCEVVRYSLTPTFGDRLELEVVVPGDDAAIVNLPAEVMERMLLDLAKRARELIDGAD